MGQSARSTVAHPGHINMKRLAELLLQADQLPKNENGMVISACGLLTQGARALNDMADTPDLDVDRLEAHQMRLEAVQPRMRAHSMETLAEHLGMLHEAVVAGDAATIGKFFNLYVFD